MSMFDLISPIVKLPGKRYTSRKQNWPKNFLFSVKLLLKKVLFTDKKCISWCFTNLFT